MAKSNVTVSESVARAGRTAPQGGLAWAVTEGIDAFVYDMADRQYGVLIVLLTMLFAFIQSAIENGVGHAFLRNIPPTESPIVDDDEPTGYDLIEDVEGRHEREL